jgi:membrane protease YdiL (CAAX protease family)
MKISLGIGPFRLLLRAHAEAFKLLLVALGWLVLAKGAAILGARISTLAYSAAGKPGGPPIMVFVLASVVSFLLVMLLASFRLCRIAGIRPLQEPIRQWRVLPLLLTADLASTAFWWASRGPPSPWSWETMSAEALLASAGTGLRVMFFLVVTGLAPVSEELFFRGWLWDSLRRSWGLLPVVIVTALLWVAGHLVGDREALGRLAIVAILVCCARHFCGSIRASIIVHGFHNLLGTLLLFHFYAGM